MGKEYIMAAVLLGIMLAVCIVHLAQTKSLMDGKCAFATIGPFVGFRIAIVRIIEEWR